jgi:hypothetical protein
VSALQTLEERLKSQRNKPAFPHEIGFISLVRSRRTGGIAVPYVDKDGDFVCNSTKMKREKASAEQDGKDSILSRIIENGFNVKRFPLDLSKMSKSEGNSWIAIVHADGNGLGLLIQKMGNILKGRPDDEVKLAFKEFSTKLDEATRAAAKSAFRKISIHITKGDIPFRPVVLGGDDHTVIIRADLALDYTAEFLRSFELETKLRLAGLFNNLGLTAFENGLTACAGIAYVKHAYPMHYALTLSEQLCKEAKKMVKNGIMADRLPESALAFHKVQDSFVDDKFDNIISRSLKTKTGINLFYGPYWLRTAIDRPSVEVLVELQKKMDLLSTQEEKQGLSTGKIRQWISELYKNSDAAQFMFERMKAMSQNNPLLQDLELKDSKTIAYDLIQLQSFK